MEGLNSHDLAKELLSMPPKEVTISLDISTCDEDAGRRAFSGAYFGINDKESHDLVLLFEGTIND